MGDVHRQIILLNEGNPKCCQLFTVNQDVFVLKVWGFVLGAGSDSIGV